MSSNILLSLKEHCRNKLFTKALIIFVPDKAENLRIVALRNDFLTCLPQAGVIRGKKNKADWVSYFVIVPKEEVEKMDLIHS